MCSVGSVRATTRLVHFPKLPISKRRSLAHVRRAGPDRHHASDFDFVFDFDFYLNLSLTFALASDFGFGIQLKSFSCLKLSDALCISRAALL